MNDKKILIDMLMIESGIVPSSSSGSVKKMLDTLSEEDRRKAKRKFRKHWRNICKNDPSLKYSMGFGESKPTLTQMGNRRAWVRKMMSEKITKE